jgi:asparagine synthetase B (glutamine-hydrolysing)
MCGLFGFFGYRPDMNVVAEAALLAARRGPDGWGVMTDHSVERGLGRLPTPLARSIAADRFVIGHCRLATVLGSKSIQDGQPIRVGRYVVAHNGCVANADDLREAFGYTPDTRNDSEAIARLMCRLPGTTDERLTAALETVDHGGHYAVTALDLELMTIHLRANCMPLWVRRAQEGVYWCSIRPDESWEGCRG